MPKLTPEDLSRLYPQAKSFDELEAERRLRDLERYPRFVSEKISLCTALCGATVFAVYHLVLRTMAGSLSSAGSVLSGVSFSILVLAAGMATLWYLYSLIDGLVSRVITAASLLYGALAGVLFVSGLVHATLARFAIVGMPAIATTLLLSFLLAYFSVRLIIRHQ